MDSSLRVSELGYHMSRSISSLDKFCRVNSESAMARAQLALKGNGRRDSDWFIARYAQKTPITH